MTPKRPVRGHTEASTIVFTQFVLEGVDWHLTLREGATAETTLALLAECSKVQAALTEAGATFVLNRDAHETLLRRQSKHSGGNGAGNGNSHTARQSDGAMTGPPSPQPGQVTAGNGSKRAVVKTPAWATTTAALASRHACFRRADDKPDWLAMTQLAAEAGFKTITDDNLLEVIAALEEAAQQALTL